MMGDRSVRRLSDIVKQEENHKCADCGLKGPEWASYNIGVFLCTVCAAIHRKIGAHISKVKSLKLDRWDDCQVDVMEEVGNQNAKKKYEEKVPTCYRIPHPGDPQVLLEQWIRAKYERQEFIFENKQVYTQGYMEGTLLKKSKDENKYYPRKFVLSELDNSLKYYVKENAKEPKNVITLPELNVCLAPSKLNIENSMQLSYLNEGSTRHIFVQHESGEILIQWYMAIRSAKLYRLKVAYPSINEEEFLPHLTYDFVLEGLLWKTGPNERDAYRKRWFILDDRKLMYHDGQMDAFPKGEVFLGYKDDGYCTKIGVPRGCKEHDNAFHLVTPERTYVMAANCEEERNEWMKSINSVLERPLRPQDNQMAVNLVRRRGYKFNLDIFNFG